MEAKSGKFSASELRSDNSSNKFAVDKFFSMHTLSNVFFPPQQNSMPCALNTRAAAKFLVMILSMVSNLLTIIDSLVPNMGIAN
jgi:hypothetical protein